MFFLTPGMSKTYVTHTSRIPLTSFKEKPEHDRSFNTHLFTLTPHTETYIFTPLWRADI